MFDRTTKLLLTLIAAALWALVLRPVFSIAPARAEGAPVNTGPSARFTAPVVRVHEATGRVIVVDDGGWVYLLDPGTLEIRHTVRLTPAP